MSLVFLRKHQLNWKVPFHLKLLPKVIGPFENAIFFYRISTRSGLAVIVVFYGVND